MAITAFPVLARILTDRGIERSELGIVALTCARADVVTAWCLLAFAVGVAQADLLAAATTIVLALAFVVFMLGVVRPFMKSWCENRPHAPGSDATAAVLVAVLISSLTTDLIGIHALFG